MDLFKTDFKQFKKLVLKMSIENLTFISADATVDFLPQRICLFDGTLKTWQKE